MELFIHVTDQTRRVTGNLQTSKYSVITQSGRQTVSSAGRPSRAITAP